MICFRYIIVNTLHKGENKDNNKNKRKRLGGKMWEQNTCNGTSGSSVKTGSRSVQAKNSLVSVSI
jgi:hypothetical protein